MVFGKRDIRIFNRRKTDFVYTQQATLHWRIRRGDEYILSFLFPIQLQFRLTNDAGPQNNELLYLYLSSVPDGRNAKCRHIANAEPLAAANYRTSEVQQTKK